MFLKILSIKAGTVFISNYIFVNSLKIGHCMNRESYEQKVLLDIRATVC